MSPCYPLLFQHNTHHGHGGNHGVRPLGARGQALVEILEQGRRHGVEEIFIPKYVGE